MIRDCEGDHYALVTGIQLLNMAIAAEADTSTKDKIAQLLFDGDGPVIGYEAWDMHVTKTESKEEESPDVIVTQ